MTSLPQAAFFLFLEAATGGAIALFWLHARGEVTRGFTLFTGIAYLIVGALAIWIRTAFPPSVAIALSPAALLWFNVEQTLTIAFLVLLAIHLVLLARQRQPVPSLRILLPVVPLLALGALWSAALVDASQQLGGLGTPLAVLAGAIALGAALTGLSLGHWYLVSPGLSVKPLVLVNFLCLGAVMAQTALGAVLLLAAPEDQRTPLLTEYGLFLGVRVVFGLVVPIIGTVMTWRTARIRSLDSATGLLYIVAALILAGEIAARTLYFLTGVAT